MIRLSKINANKTKSVVTGAVVFPNFALWGNFVLSFLFFLQWTEFAAGSFTSKCKVCFGTM